MPSYRALCKLLRNHKTIEIGPSKPKLCPLKDTISFLQVMVLKQQLESRGKRYTPYDRIQSRISTVGSCFCVYFTDLCTVLRASRREVRGRCLLRTYQTKSEHGFTLNIYSIRTPLPSQASCSRCCYSVVSLLSQHSGGGQERQ